MFSKLESNKSAATPAEKINARGSLRTSAAASYTGISERLLKKWRGKKAADPGEHGPRWIAITPRLIVYRIADLDAWLEARAGSTRAQPNALAPNRETAKPDA